MGILDRLFGERKTREQLSIESRARRLACTHQVDRYRYKSYDKLLRDLRQQVENMGDDDLLNYAYSEVIAIVDELERRATEPADAEGTP